ncbi:hypothetical protein B0H66DRAFT_81279 [Apodospora peruviana]|uniref:Uncharacterized protein n=1 Tax=Apodospora peruviana TaxID=516989 RepID=A0AAE0ITE7_9PEZI|nr:hypothetical protein B0H66DRAFT_81279 [Apodospora peruviana]
MATCFFFWLFCFASWMDIIYIHRWCGGLLEDEAEHNIGHIGVCRQPTQAYYREGELAGGLEWMEHLAAYSPSLYRGQNDYFLVCFPVLCFFSSRVSRATVFRCLFFTICAYAGCFGNYYGTLRILLAELHRPNGFTQKWAPILHVCLVCLSVELGKSAGFWEDVWFCLFYVILVIIQMTPDGNLVSCLSSNHICIPGCYTPWIWR